MTAVVERTVGRTLIPPTLFDRLVRRIIIDDDLPAERAERIMDQTLAFLGACAREHDEPLAPSELVDIGWHAFVLHTKDYTAFCERVAGRYLHHMPTEKSDPSTTAAAASAILARTVAAIETAGFIVDPDLWPRGAVSDCTGCHNGCHDDPPPAHQ